MDIENNNAKKDSDSTKTGAILIRIGRTVAFIAAVFLIFMLLSEGSLSGINTGDAAGILLIVFAVIALAAYVLSIWKVKYAGIVLIAVSLAFAVHVIYYLSSGQFAAWAMMGLPHLIAGGLLIIGRRIKNKAG
jgi:predicted transporter